MNGTDPDYRIEGEYADCYAPSSNNSKKVRNVISNKVADGQASRIVLNLSDTDLTTANVLDVLQRKPITGLEEVIGITKDGEIVQIHPQNRR